MARPKKDESSADTVQVTSTELLFMRDNLIRGLGHLEAGVHELKRAYVTQSNTLLPEGHPGRITVPFFPTFDKNAPGALVPLPLPGVRAETPGGAAAAAAATEANMKRKRKPHDPNAPKRALTSYFLFMQHNKPAIKELHPDWTAQQVSDESERRWSNINDKERQDYEYMYQVDLARYYKQKECYERGEPVPEITPEEARRLYAEHIKSGVPFKGRKGKKDPVGSIPAPATTTIVDATHTVTSSEDEAEEEDEEEEEEEQAPPPKTKRQKTGKETASKSTSAKAAAKAKPVEAPAPVVEAPKSPEKTKKKVGRKSKAAEEAPAVVPEVESLPPAKTAPKNVKKSSRKRKSTAADE